MKDKQTTGNTGEWSELYALGFILANGGAFGADKDQNRKEDLFYKVLKVIFSEKIGEEKMSYEIKDESVDIFEGDKKLATVKINKIKNALNNMFEGLSVVNEGRAYPLDSGSEMMDILKKQVIKASSFNKKDLDLVMLDIKTRKPTPETGFSIKSQLGSPSTLVNASAATNFKFEIKNKDGDTPKLKDFPELHPKNVKDNIKKLRESGLSLVFSGMDSDTFFNNLSLIDSRLPENLSKILLSYYSREASKFADLALANFPEDKSGNKQAVHKIKEFLSTMALGMMPNTEWDGILTSLGGFLLVKKDGDVLCYYLYNLSDFQDYLLENTKLDTPSTSRYGIGQIIEEEGKFFIKLNLQVRFTK